MKLYNEFGEPLKHFDGWQESGSIIIQFSTEEEPENYAEIFISEEEIKFYEDKTTPEQYAEVEKYAKEAQQSIRNHIEYCRDIEKTEEWIAKTSRNW